MNTNKNSTPNPRISPFQLAISLLMILLVLNALVFPLFDSKKIEKTDYGTFMELVDQGDVLEVEQKGGDIYFITKSKGADITMVTGAWASDTEIVERLYTKGVKFSQVVPDQATPIQMFLFNWVLPFVLIFGLSRMLTKNLSKRMGGGAMSFGKSNAKIYAESENKVTFKDVAGQEEAKEALIEIVDFLHNPKKYTEIGARLPKGALLVGPPGTGKTLIARAVAGEAGVPFFSISGSEFVEMFVGMGASKVRDLFKQANEKAPCIVFIDEIDTIGKRRDGAGFGGNDEREQTLNQLLSEMDGFDSSKGVVMLAATNRPDSLDPALLRPGRFDRRVPMELPDLSGREAVLEVHAKAVKLGPDIDFRKIALATAGASGADLANMINEAALRAVRNGRFALTQADLEESVEIVIAGYQRKNAVISVEEKRIISYHEIGHALVAAKQSDAAPIHKITIIPRTSGTLGYTMQVDEEEKHLLNKEQLLARITTLTGGRAAEEVMVGSFTTGASNDIVQATNIARSMVTKYGMTEEFDMVALETTTNIYLGGDSALAASQETATKIDTKVIAIVKACHEKALEIISDNKGKMEELAKFLLDRETITGKEFMDILNAPAGGGLQPATETTTL